jgi:enterobacteria phage integrase
MHIVIVTTAYGKPFSVDGFSRFMRDAITQAGLPFDCKHHALHKASGRMLAEARATSKMIMAVLGHTTHTEAERYCEEAEQAAIKLEAHKQPRNMPRASSEAEHQLQAFEPPTKKLVIEDVFVRKI